MLGSGGQEAQAMTVPDRTLPFRTALRDLGFFYGLFTFIVSGPSVLSLLQTIFIEHRLVDALQWIVDGYDRIAAMVGDAIEPVVAPAIALAERMFALDLTLQPYWRPLFILMFMLVVGWTRVAWHFGARAGAIALAASGVTGALIGAILAGLAPSTEPSIVAACPGFFAVLFAAPPLASMSRGSGKNALGLGFLSMMALAIAGLGIAAAAIWQEAGFPAAGLLGVGTVIMVVGALAALAGLTGGRASLTLHSARLSLILLGGFFTAMLVLFADTVLRVLQEQGAIENSVA
ncbi:MAG: hypothetical protein ACT4OF_16925 [Caulobacteraceae bacterium]